MKHLGTSKYQLCLAIVAVAAVLMATLAAQTALAQMPTPTPGIFLPVVSGGSRNAAPTPVTPTPVSPNAVEEIFPSGMAVASPLNVVKDGDRQARSSATGPSSFTPAYTVIAERIRATLLSTTIVPITDTVRSLVMAQSGKANCYGPALYYANHPNGAAGHPSLPTGDLGIWLEYEPQQWSDPNQSPTITQTIGITSTESYTLTYGSPGHGCAAAQLNTLMNGIESQSEAALTLAAALVSEAVRSGTSVPSDGLAVDLTVEMNANYDFAFTTAVISRTSDSIYYTLAFTATEDQLNSRLFSSATVQAAEVDTTATTREYDVTIRLQHNPDSSDPSNVYAGLLTYQIIDSDYRGGLHCGAATTSPTAAAISGSLNYNRSSASDLKVQSRKATFCIDDAGSAFDANGVVLSGWSDNYAAFTANFDPTAAFTRTGTFSNTLTTELAGTYTFAWQAGNGDGYARVLNVGVNDHSPIDGEAYFGFGKRIQEAIGHTYTITSTTGTVQTLTPDEGVLAVEGMVCNWAGPGATHTLQPYAQRQFVRLNEITGFFAVPAGGSDIRYAPTNNCLYEDAGGSYDNTTDFWYDRNLNGVQDEVYTDSLADENVFGDRGVASLSSITADMHGAFDLMDTEQGGDDYQTVVNLIVNGRGFDLPTAP